MSAEVEGTHFAVEEQTVGRWWNRRKEMRLTCTRCGWASTWVTQNDLGTLGLLLAKIQHQWECRGPR